MSEPQDKLSWSAFRYVANELDASEISEFESRLMTEQAARSGILDIDPRRRVVSRIIPGVVPVPFAATEAGRGEPTVDQSRLDRFGRESRKRLGRGSHRSNGLSTSVAR